MKCLKKTLRNSKPLYGEGGLKPASQYEVHPTQLHRWKAEAIENLPSLFTCGASELEKMRKQYEAEKEELTRQIGQLTIEVNWLKKSAELHQRRRKT